MQIPNFNLSAFKEASYFTCIKMVKAATFACRDTVKHIYTNAIPAYVFSSLAHNIYTHATNVVSKAPTCFGVHLIGQSISQGPSFIVHKILSGEWLELLPTSIKQQIFGTAKEEARRIFQVELCKVNSLEIAEEYLAKHLKERPPETLQLFCDNKSLQECAKDYRETCPSQTIPLATDSVCADVNSDIAMIQGSSRLLGALLCGAVALYFIKNLFSSEPKLENAPQLPILETPKTKASDIEQSVLPEDTDKKPALTKVSLILEEIFNDPYLHKNLIKSLKEKAICQQ